MGVRGRGELRSAMLELFEAIRRLFRQDRLDMSHEAKRRNEQDRKSRPHHWTGSPDRGRSSMRAEENQDQGQPRPSGSPGEDTSPVVPAGSPVASLIYEGAIHYADSLGRDNPRFNEDDLELVGVSKSNRLVPGSAAGWDIYKLKGGEEGYIYTFSPGQSFLNEDGRTITTDPKWVLWIAAGSTPLFFCTPTPPAAC